ncbi:peptidoglycan DD-metalloendopeptidase family protein [Mucilaginibacter sp.]|uniref:M23 family metallopeptidase n=1 Tax=Mucilaginibacter sp. TaxID=1882438 RepID=UPI003263ACE4
MRKLIKNIGLAIILTCMAATAFAQQESPGSNKVISKFKNDFNAGRFDSIYSTFSGEAKSNLPHEKTTAFLTQLKSRYGKIINAAFISYQDQFAGYKTKLEKGTITLNIAIDDKQAITGLFAKPYVEDSAPKMPRNITAMQLPFKGVWTVFWGGDTKEQNYHGVVAFQKNAFDIIITDNNNKSFRSDGKANEDYYAFGQQLFAPCDGEVVLAVDGVKDNLPGVLNPLFATGNTVLLKTSNNEYVLLAHLKQYSVQVKQGGKVKQGQLLGFCGNSGNSSEPHLHFHLQDQEDFGKATGIKCYFTTIEVNGRETKNYSPVKGDHIHQP